MATDDRGVVRQRASTLLAPLRLRHFRRLWVADMVSLLGDWAGRLALMVVVLERTGSPAWAAAVTAVSLAGFVGVGQVLATLADRHGRVRVMLAADFSRAALFGAMLLPLPVGVLLLLAFVAGLATPPFEAARSAAIPDLVPEEQYGDALALAGISVQSSLVIGYALGGALLSVVEPEVALAVNACTFLLSAAILWELRHTAAAEPASVPASVGRSLGDGFASIFRDRLVRRALAIVAVTGALGTVGEALVVPYGVDVGMPEGTLGLLAAAVPVGTLLGTAAIAAGVRDHHRLLRNAAWCGVVTSAAAAPLFWLEASGPYAFVAFAIAGGMFAVSIPTNTVIGTRLSRDTRASAMGIAVGVLMGSQALGAAVGGIAASQVGTPQAIAGALGLATVFCLWSAASTPHEAKHLLRAARSPRPVPEETVLDLVSLEGQRTPARVP
ncbi:MAG: MFS transporter [Acidimicrobiales bacterium]